jgi:hypothetical protein
MYFKHNGMFSIKIITASQARYVNQYKNLESNVLICCTNIYFNRKSLKQNLTPNYTKIKIPNTLPASTFTKPKIVKQQNNNKINIYLCQMEYIFYFILLMFFKHNWMSSTKIILKIRLAVMLDRL